MVSPRVKFIAITIDELLLVPIVIVIVNHFAPEWTLPVAVIMIVGAAIFVAGKYYLVYDSLLEGSYMVYDLEGMTGKVIDKVTSNSGKIKVGAEIWDARCKDGEIPVGARVRIVARESMTVHVELLEVADE